MLVKSLVIVFILLNPLTFFTNQSISSLSSSQVETKGHWQEYGKSLISALWLTNPNFLPIRDWAINEPETKAKAALVFNLDKNQILYQKNIDQVLPIASLTKLMTSLIVIEKMRLSKIVTISENALNGYGNQGDLVINEQISVRNLLYALLMESSNDAALALAEQNDHFIDLMNQKAQELGLKNTSFVDPSGYDPANRSTAREMAQLVEYSFKYPLIWEIMKTPEINLAGHYWVNTDELLNRLPNIIGGKTGYTNQAQGCLIIVIKQPGRERLVTVVLGAQQRFLETEKLINWVEKAYLW